MEPKEQERYARHLYQVALYQTRRLTLSEDDREDCVMEFVGRMLRLEALEGEEAKFHSNAWLHRFARRHVLNWSLALQRREPLTQPLTRAEEKAVVDIVPTPEDIALSAVFWQQLAHTLGQMAARPCRLFVAFYLQGYTTSELAQAFGMTPNAVEQSLLRTRRLLRDVLAQKAGMREPRRSVWRLYAFRPVFLCCRKGGEKNNFRNFRARP